jgi:hypothetical protein
MLIGYDFCIANGIVLDFQRGKLILQNDGESIEIEILNRREEARGMENCYGSLNNRQVIALPTPRGFLKKADDEKSQLEAAHNTLLQITERSGNLQKALKRDIVESVSTLRSIFTNLKNKGEEQNKEINRLEGELTKVMEQLRTRRDADQRGITVPSRIGTWTTLEGGPQSQLSPSGGARKAYSEAVRNSKDKRFKLLIKSKINLSTEAIKRQ